MKSDKEIMQLLESDPNAGMVQVMEQYLKLVHSIAAGLKNPEDVKEKSQSIMNLDGPTDEQAIRDALRMLPAEYVRKVRIYATTLVEIFYNR